MKLKSRSNYSKPAPRPVVSVVIPVFNGASHLVEAVRSVQKSTYKQFEILLVDDGSTDKSKALCQQLVKKYKNVRFYDFRRNRGLGRVLNFALQKAKGKYICRLNQDDRMLPHRLSTQVRYLDNRSDVVALGSSIRLFHENGGHQTVEFLPTDEEIKNVWYIVSPFADPSVMYRKDTALRAGGYDQSFWPADDTHLWYRMGLKGKLANLQRPVVEVRFHDNAASMKFFRKLAIKTYQMHLWTNAWIKAAPWYIHLYWLIQLGAGLLLTPKTNWTVYWYIKRVLNAYETRLLPFIAKLKETTVTKVTSHPTRLSLSGV